MKSREAGSLDESSHLQLSTVELNRAIIFFVNQKIGGPAV